MAVKAPIDALGEELDQEMAAYAEAVANLRYQRERVYAAIRKAHRSGHPEFSTRGIAKRSGGLFTYGRIGQIVVD